MIRTNWDTPPLEEEMDEWKIYVAVYEELGWSTPARWIVGWHRQQLTEEDASNCRRAVNIYILRKTITVTL